mmetsp:Transcript_30631/g.99585  ORF Transcript_30631/g.99585 Transcript_30631/m.99585 type:complete len:223 (+) Transcript_30631:1890-2558(+)
MQASLREMPRSVSHGFDRGDLARGVEPLRAHLAAVHDGVAAVKLEGVVDGVQALLRRRVAAVDDPAVRLEQHSGPEVLVAVPPVRRARGGAARAEDALVHPVQLGAVLLALEAFNAHLHRLTLGKLEVRLDRLVLRVKVGHVHHQILDDVHVRKRRDGLLRGRLVHAAEARERVLAVDVHRARPANPFSTRPPETQRAVLLRLDLNQHIQHHRPAIVCVHLV